MKGGEKSGGDREAEGRKQAEEQSDAEKGKGGLENKAEAIFLQ